MDSIPMIFLDWALTQEWVCPLKPGLDVCPVCLCTREKGHANDCGLDKTLAPMRIGRVAWADRMGQRLNSAGFPQWVYPSNSDPETFARTWDNDCGWVNRQFDSCFGPLEFRRFPDEWSCFSACSYKPRSAEWAHEVGLYQPVRPDGCGTDPRVYSREERCWVLFPSNAITFSPLLSGYRKKPWKIYDGEADCPKEIVERWPIIVGDKAKTPRGAWTSVSYLLTLCPYDGFTLKSLVGFDSSGVEVQMGLQRAIWVNTVSGFRHPFPAPGFEMVEATAVDMVKLCE